MSNEGTPGPSRRRTRRPTAAAGTKAGVSALVPQAPPPAESGSAEATSSQADDAQAVRDTTSRPSAEADPGLHDASGQATPSRSAAGLLAFLLFAWALSLLLFDWLRTDAFEPSGRDHLILLAPVFGGAVIAAVVAVAARLKGASPVGGSLVHRFGLASGVMALAALILLRLSPDVRAANEAGLERVAIAQLENIAAALELHRERNGSYPIGMGIDSLATALVPELLDQEALSQDPWRRQLRYQSMNDGDGYLLISTGHDGVQDLPLAVCSEMADGALLLNDVVVRTGHVFAPLQAPSSRSSRRAGWGSPRPQAPR